MAKGTPAKPQPGRTARGVQKPFQPAIGREFDIQEETEKTRSFLARSIVLTTIAAVAAAGGYGLYTGKFGTQVSLGR